MATTIDETLPEGFRSSDDKPMDSSLPEFNKYKDHRLGIGADLRIYSIGAATFVSGTVLGMFQEYGRAALRFRAENAHRLPRSERNWFFYHRAKSLDALKSAMPYGTKLGLKMAPWSMGFLLMEEGVDHARGGTSKDFLSDVVAGASIAGLYSLWTRQKIPEAGRLIKVGMGTGLCYGLIQDGVSYLSGQRLFYVDYLRRAFGSPVAETEADATLTG